MDGWNTTVLLGWPIFRCYVSFREGTSSEYKPSIQPWADKKTTQNMQERLRPIPRLPALDWCFKMSRRKRAKTFGSLGGVDEILERNINGKNWQKMSSIAWYSSPEEKKLLKSNSPSNPVILAHGIPLFTGRINQVATLEVSRQNFKYIRTLTNQPLF